LECIVVLVVKACYLSQEVKSKSDMTESAKMAAMVYEFLFVKDL